MKKYIISFFILFLVVVAVIWHISTRIYSPNGNRIEKVSIGDYVFYAEVVSSGEKLQKGLGGRENLCENCAMLFKFPQLEKYSFWMKDMQFPLDIIWLRNREVVHIEKNVSKDFSGILAPQTEADQVVELNAGVVDKAEIKEGEIVSF